MKNVAIVSLLLLTAILAFSGAEPPAAEGAFPGQNGLIAFENGGDIWVIKPDGNGLKNITNTPAIFERTPAWSADGEKIAFAANDQQSELAIFTMNADGSAAQPVTHPLEDQGDIGPSWSPDGTMIAFTSQIDSKETVEWVNLQTSVEAVIPGTETLILNEELSWSPDGGEIVFRGNCDSGCKLYVVTGPAGRPLR